MAIYRVNIVTERANFHQLFTDHQQALSETDKFLFENELNDGCSLGSEEDFIALNAVLAEIFDDCYNADNFAQWDDIEQGLLDYLAENIRHQEAMQPGTVSRATMREQDICQSCIEALYSVDPAKVTELLEKEPKVAEALYDSIIDQSQNDYWETEDAFLFVAEDLFDVMDSYSPEGHYFGNNEGDLSDFGYWPDEDHQHLYQ